MHSIRKLGTAIAASGLLGAVLVSGMPAGAQASVPVLAKPELPAIAQHFDMRTFLQQRAHQESLLRGAGLPAAVGARAHALAGAPHGLVGPGGTWTNLGPAPIPNGQTNVTAAVPVSGRVSAIAVDPTNPNILYLGAAQGGVWRSADDGATWTPLMDTAASLAIGALAIAPSDHTTLYVGTGEANLSGDAFDGVGVYRIDNADTTATVVGPINPAGAGSTLFAGHSISKILVKPNDPATILVSTNYGGIGIDGGSPGPTSVNSIWRSTNATAAAGSVTFTQLSPTNNTTDSVGVTDMVFDPTDATSNTIIAGAWDVNGLGTGRIYRSVNALAASPTFSVVYSETTPFSRIALAAATFQGQAIFYAGTAETQTIGANTVDGKLHNSTGGTSWGTLSAGTGFCYPQCFYDIVVTVPSNDPTTIYLGGSYDGTVAGGDPVNHYIVAKSTDSGASFSQADTTLHSDDHAIALAPFNANLIYTGSDGGLWRSADAGASWLSRNTAGLSITQFQSIAVHPTDPNFTIGGTQDNGTEMLSSAATYTRADFGDGGYSLIDRNAVDTVNVTMYHTYFNQKNSLIGFARVDTTANAHDNGWTFYGCPSGGGTVVNGITCSDSVNFYAPMALGGGNPNTLYFGTDRLYRSTNKGNTMTVVSQAPISTGVPISAIGVSPQNDNVRIVGLDDGHVWATTTGSSTLTDVTPTATSYAAGAYVARAVVDPTNANTAYITLSDFLGGRPHVWKTTNLAGGGSSWAPMSSGLPEVPVDSFVVNPQTPTTLYAGTDIGVYRSLDGGGSWTPYGTGLPTVAVFDMALTASGSGQVLRISTHGRGQWQIPLFTTPPPNVAEVPLLPLLPLTALAGGAVFAIGRRRNRVTR